MNKNSSFSIFLNIVLGLLLFGSIAFSYFFGNFGGISIQELKKSYLNKEDVKFADLPMEIQKKYISKDEIKVKPKQEAGLEKVFDELGNPIAIIEGDLDDLQIIIKSLQDRVMFLEQENLFLSNDKNELLKIVQSEKSTRQIEESTLLSKNLEKINEAEKQHYQNISELTMKINDLQRENITLSDQLNRQKQSAKEQIDTLSAQISEAKAQADLSQSESLKKQTIKYENLEKEKVLLEKKVVDISKLLQEQRDSQIILLAKKDKELVDLQNKINALIMEKNTLLTQNSQSVIDLEKKYSTKLQEVEQSIKKYQEDKVALKESYEARIKQTTLDSMKLINSLKDENKKFQDELNKVSQNSISILENSERSLKDKEFEYKKLLAQIQRKFDADLKSESTKNVTLQEKLTAATLLATNLNKEVEKFKTEIQKYNDQTLQLNDKIATLETKNRSLDTEVGELVKANELKHNKNYKFLNEKIATLETTIKDMTLVTGQEKSKQQTIFDEKVRTLEQKYVKLNTDYSELQQELRKKELHVSKLENSLKDANQAKEHLAKNEHEKLIEIRDSFEELQKEFKKKETSYEKEILALKETLKSMDKQIVSDDTVPISDKKRKLALLGQVECDDMNSGNFKVSDTCKKRVAEFLSNYSEENFFEVIPIVGKGGFGSLNKLRNNTLASMPESEINRLTDLANLGLGKHRAKEGGWLIREQFGDFAKISYTVYNIEADDKRGFVIRAYR